MLPRVGCWKSLWNSAHCVARAEGLKAWQAWLSHPSERQQRTSCDEDEMAHDEWAGHTTDEVCFSCSS